MIGQFMSNCPRIVKCMTNSRLLRQCISNCLIVGQCACTCPNGWTVYVQLSDGWTVCFQLSIGWTVYVQLSDVGQCNGVTLRLSSLHKTEHADGLKIWLQSNILFLPLPRAVSPLVQSSEGKDWPAALLPCIADRK